LAKARDSRDIVSIALDSPGGSILEAVKLTDAIREHRWSTLVLGGSQCASACFLLFAAGTQRYAGIGALIGVHSASDSGAETLGSLAVTTLMARTLSSLGVPPEIIGKMVQTEPRQVAWLTGSDLSSMGVAVIQASAGPDAPAPLEPDEVTVERLPMDMQRYCRENFGSRSKATVLNRRDAATWRCRTNKGLVGISLLKLCHQQYGPNYVYELGDRFDASSWSCVSKVAN